MKTSEFDKLAKQETNRMLDVMCSKSADYADDKDKLFNFKQAGRIDGITPIEALRGMWLKHRASIQQGLDELLEGKPPRPRDWWIEKLTDDRNYNLLFFGLLEEQYFIPGGTSPGYSGGNGRSVSAVIFDEFDFSEYKTMLALIYGADPLTPNRIIEDSEPEEFEEFIVRFHTPSIGINDCGWYIDVNCTDYLHKDLKLHGSTGKESQHGYGEAPGYYPTKEIAEAYVRAYEEKNR